MSNNQEKIKELEYIIKELKFNSLKYEELKNNIYIREYLWYFTEKLKSEKEFSFRLKKINIFMYAQMVINIIILIIPFDFVYYIFGKIGVFFQNNFKVSFKYNGDILIYYYSAMIISLMVLNLTIFFIKNKINIMTFIYTKHFFIFYYRFIFFIIGWFLLLYFTPFGQKLFNSKDILLNKIGLFLYISGIESVIYYFYFNSLFIFDDFFYKESGMKEIEEIIIFSQS